MKYHIEPCTEELDIVSTADQCKVLSPQIKGKWKESTNACTSIVSIFTPISDCKHLGLSQF